MTPAEVMQILEYHRPKTVGGMHEDDRESIIERMMELESQGVEVI